MSILLANQQVISALTPATVGAPQGINSLNSLPDETIMTMLTHPDTVRVVTNDSFLLTLPAVDQDGYAVYNDTFTLDHLIVYDMANPNQNLSVTGTRDMVFGLSSLDLGFMTLRKHGDIFYIAYNSGVDLPRIVMVVVVDPAIVLAAQA